LALIQDLEEEFIVMNGDILTDLEFADLIKSHRKSGAKVTICTYRKAVPISLGVLEISGDEVRDYIEKPVYSFYVSMGIYAINRSVVRNIPPNRYLDFPSFIKNLIASKEPLNVYRFEGEWFDIGREEDYKQVLEKLANG
jgi:NDP-sugar pyrophosphorylase family protein